MDSLAAMFERLQIEATDAQRCFVRDDINGLAIFALIKPGDPVHCSFFGHRLEGKVVGDIPNIRLEYMGSNGVYIKTGRSARKFLLKVANTVPGLAESTKRDLSARNLLHISSEGIERNFRDLRKEFLRLRSAKLMEVQGSLQSGFIYNKGRPEFIVYVADCTQEQDELARAINVKLVVQPVPTTTRKELGGLCETLISSSATSLDQTRCGTLGAVVLHENVRKY